MTAFFLLLSLSAHAKTQPALWDYWYTVTVAGTQHYSYYNDRVEKLGDDKVIFKNHVWKKDEGTINEEQLGAAAKADEELTPAFYNYHSTFGTTEKSIDGTVVEGKNLLTVKAREGGKNYPVVTRSLPKGTIFSVMLEVWLGAHLKEIEKGKEISFSTVLEDNIADGFPTVPGRIKLEKPDSNSKALKATKLRITYAGHQALWWVESTGAVLRIEMPDQHIVVQKTTESAAKKFLTP